MIVIFFAAVVRPRQQQLFTKTKKNEQILLGFCVKVSLARTPADGKADLFQY